MRFRLVEAEETAIPGGSGSLPDWSSITSTKEKARQFETYFNQHLPPFTERDTHEGDFDRANLKDINIYLDQVFPDLGGKGLPFKTAAVSSIQGYGVKPSANRFIPFMILANDKKLKLDDQKADLIRKYLQSGQLNIQKAWLANEKAYKGSAYKIQALLLLSDKNAVKQYMDPKAANDLIEAVLALNTDKEIERALNNAQTRHGEERYNRGRSGSGRGGKSTSNKSRLVRMLAALGVAESKATELVNRVFNPKESESSLVHKIMLLAAEEKGVDLDAASSESEPAR